MKARQQNAGSAAWALLTAHAELAAALKRDDIHEFGEVLAAVSTAYAGVDRALDLLHTIVRSPPKKPA